MEKVNDNCVHLSKLNLKKNINHIDLAQIILEDSIKSLGNYKIAINLGYELDTKIKIKVLASK